MPLLLREEDTEEKLEENVEVFVDENRRDDDSFEEFEAGWNGLAIIRCCCWSVCFCGNNCIPVPVCGRRGSSKGDLRA